MKVRPKPESTAIAVTSYESLDVLSGDLDRLNTSSTRPVALELLNESAARLRGNPRALPVSALQKSAKLLQAFGENYHEKLLEEAQLFPAVKKAGGAAAALVDPLIAQHQRGRAITDYVIAVTAQPLGAAAAEPLARALEGFARMYEAHAAHEDTVVFPAWKKAIGAHEVGEMGDKFEDIEKAQFGGDGFDMAVKQIGEIEQTLGLSNLAAFTAPPIH